MNLNRLFICCLFCIFCFVSTSHATSTCLPSIEVTFSGDDLSVYVVSSKDLSNVVLQFCDETTYKFDGLSVGQTGTFSHAGKRIIGVWVKSGCNSSGDCPGCGEFFGNEIDCECVDLGCGCDEPAPGPCGCDLSIIDLGCGCGEPAPEECGCNPNIINLGCGCGLPAPNECGCDSDIVDLGCGCGEPAPNECGCDPSIVDLGCGCGEPAPGECGCEECPNPTPTPTPPTPTPTPTPTPECDKDCLGVCDGDAVVDDCGICDGHNKDKDCLGICFGDNVDDECLVCAGDNSSCADCAGVPNGPNIVDLVGDCCLPEIMIDGLCFPQPKCVEKTVHVKTTKVRRSAKVIDLRAKDFASRAKKCGGKKTERYVKKATRLFKKFRSVLKIVELRVVDVCEGKCVVVKYKKQLRKLRRLARRMHVNALNSKLNSVAVCRIPPRTTPCHNCIRSIDYLNDLIKKISKLSKKKKVC